MSRGQKIDEKVWHEIINEVDIDGNGEIDFNEFSIMMQKLISDDKKESNIEHQGGSMKANTSLNEASNGSAGGAGTR